MATPPPDKDPRDIFRTLGRFIIGYVVACSVGVAIIIILF